MPVMKAVRPAVQLCFIANAVDVRRFPDHQAAVVDARLHPADVVAHDEEDVGLLLLLRLRGSKRAAQDGRGHPQCEGEDRQLVFHGFLQFTG
jgi:hypothetical protein